MPQRALADDLAASLAANDVKDAREGIEAGKPMIGIASLLSYASESGDLTYSLVSPRGS